MLPDYALDPSIPDDLIAAAHAATPTAYDDVIAAMETQFGQDDIDELGAGLIKPATPPEAIANAHRLSVDTVYVGIGYCLATVRGREFEVLPLWPDAETAWEQADLKHHETDPLKIPRGAIVFWTNGGYGHVALSVGGGMCSTTDYRRPGYVDLAPIASLASWCRGTLVGWAEDLNGVDCWPTPAKPPVMHRVFDIHDRVRLVTNARDRARRNPHASAQRVRGLEEWLKRLEARAVKHDKG